MFRVIRKADIALFCILILLALASFVFTAIRLSAPAGEVVVTLDGSPYGTYKKSVLISRRISGLSKYGKTVYFFAAQCIIII